MTRRKERKQIQFTTPDHRPMIPEFRGPADAMDHAVRRARKRYEEINPNEKNTWR